MGFGESNGSNENPEEKTASLLVTGVEALPAFAILLRQGYGVAGRSQRRGGEMSGMISRLFRR